ncbi:hypothetical protein D7319_25590 [Streptomyces radicis]|uniref:Uncharacterized protein n=1 Tax=Streptomyces radicis TaxID=1750517 RepID=A0A3A9VWS3_9ACTN|nr:hypothetical protein D7319_25590 [Streptomyces radicis]RKN16896.1 hypothetical protein D7318_24955 [Streptomyces radicis]
MGLVALAVLAVPACGSDGGAPPDGDAPRPVRTGSTEAPPPEPEVDLTDPSPSEDLTEPLAPPEPSPTPTEEPIEDQTPDLEIPGPPDVTFDREPEACEIGDDQWDDYLRDWCEDAFGDPR